MIYFCQKRQKKEEEHLNLKNNPSFSSSHLAAISLCALQPRDLCMIAWNCVTARNNSNETLDFWKHLLASVIDKHAPFITKRVKTKTVSF